MHKLCLLCALLSLTLSATSQNLVPNWSFEEYVLCPDDYGQVDRCSWWERSTNNNNPTYHTEYLHACAGGTFGSPNNTWGYQAPSTGDGYMAEVSMAPSVMTDYRENIYAPLLIPLVVGQEYEVRLNVSHTDNSQFASNNFGVKFSTVPNFPIDGICQVHDTSIVTNSTTWTTISGSFTADSAYTYICIGNFIPDANTSTVTACPSCPYVLYGYYVDDICVMDKDASLESGNCAIDVLHVDVPDQGPRPTALRLIQDTDHMLALFSEPLASDAVLSMVDPAGSMLLSQFVPAGITSFSIAIDGLAPGAYFVSVAAPDQRLVGRCVIVR